MRKFSIFFLVLLGLFGIMGCKPSKVLDPHDPNFDIGQFRYGDYSHFPNQDEAVAEVLRVSFPIGTKRSVVETTLLSAGSIQISSHGLYKDKASLGATVRRLLNGLSPEYYAVYHMTYKKPLISITPGGGEMLFAFYDENDQLLYMILQSRFVHGSPHDRYEEK